MPTPILDDFDPPRPNPPYSNLWFVAGIGMATLLLGSNLVSYYFDWMHESIGWGEWRIYVMSLLPNVVVAAGSVWLASMLLRAYPGIPTARITRDALAAGLVASGFTQLVKLAGFSHEGYLLLTVLSMLYMGAFAAAVAYGFTAWRRGKGCLIGVGLLAGWFLLTSLLARLSWLVLD